MNIPALCAMALLPKRARGTDQPADFGACTMKENSYHPQYSGDDGKERQATTSVACPRIEGLSSTDKDSSEREAASSLIDLSKFPVGTKVVRVYPDFVLDIPDSYFERCRGLHCGSSQSNPLRGYLSEEHRKEQLAYLNGRLPTNRK
jgi:hypothetical protein